MLLLAVFRAAIGVMFLRPGHAGAECSFQDQAAPFLIRLSLPY